MMEKILTLPRNEKDSTGLITFIEQNGGVNKVQFFVQMNPHSIVTPFGFSLVDGNKWNWTLCRIEEKVYKVKDGYKITLVPIDPNYSSRSFYQEDLASSLERGFAIPYIPNSNGEMPYIKHFVGREEIMPGVYLHYEWDYIDYRKKDEK